MSAYNITWKALRIILYYTWVWLDLDWLDGIISGTGTLGCLAGIGGEDELLIILHYIVFSSTGMVSESYLIVVFGFSFVNRICLVKLVLKMRISEVLETHWSSWIMLKKFNCIRVKLSQLPPKIWLKKMSGRF